MRTLITLTLASAVLAQGRPPGPGLVKPQDGARIAWFGTLDAGLKEAGRLNRPILLVAAAPHCHNIPGVW